MRPSLLEDTDYDSETIFIIIDTLRATTTLSALKESNATRFYIVNNKENARLLKKRLYPYSLLVGEERGIKVKGFDFGNSPSELVGRDLSSKHVIFTSSNGAKVLLLLENKKHVYLAALVNISRVVKEISKVAKTNRSSIVVIPAGIFGDPEHLSIEDWVTAHHLVEKLTKILTLEMCIQDKFWNETKKILQGNEDIESLFINARVGQYLKEIGYEKDIFFASKCNVFNNFLKVKKWKSLGEIKYVELE
jgi:2-phosphosulfolactate phosphatase